MLDYTCYDTGRVVTAGFDRIVRLWDTRMDTAGFDRIVRLWDTRMDHKALCSKDVNAIVESMSLAGFDLLVATGSLVNQYDVRSLEGQVWEKEVMMGDRIRCISSSLDLRGIYPCTDQLSYLNKRLRQCRDFISLHFE
ncbi:hypothetical protein MLD38_004328 [Melastoma candidum]|uniref:Uncharacterized protein n=1 Tax=Melastoma candidum TaxID=119954 RepID=A0ACB9S6V8_9MYRT|nr:hypothetical protein MLD38_004328 [Melastoma candidum]